MRLIDADKLIEFIDTFLSKTCKRDGTTIPNRWYGALKRCIEEQPTIEKGEWIPVSERLPENSGVYIVSKWVSDGVESAILTDANYYDGCGTWYNDNRINWGRDLVTNDILAWMPLPEPYKAESVKV